MSLIFCYSECVEYSHAMDSMSKMIDRARDNENRIWLLEHYEVYTGGVSARKEDILSLDHSLPIIQSNRGGKYIYHGPGQKIVYCIINLRTIHQEINLKDYICRLEQTMINILDSFGIKSFRVDGLVGIWCIDSGKIAKIGAIGVKITNWIASHGFAINVSPDLSKYDAIIPCGIAKYGVTSLEKLGFVTDYQILNEVIVNEFMQIFPELK